MMMAELVQGQASVAQPGTKDDFADTIRRVRQVNVVKRSYVQRVRPTNSVFVYGAWKDFDWGHPGHPKLLQTLLMHPAS